MIVLDSSAFLEFLLRTPAGLQVETWLSEHQTAVPQLFDAEVFARLVAFGKHGAMTGAQVGDAVEALRTAPIQRVEVALLLPVALPLSVAMSGYDALYAALARVLQVTLLTGDRGLARTADSQFGIAAVHV